MFIISCRQEDTRHWAAQRLRFLIQFCSSRRKRTLIFMITMKWSFTVGTNFGA